MGRLNLYVITGRFNLVFQFNDAHCGAQPEPKAMREGWRSVIGFME